MKTHTHWTDKPQISFTPDQIKKSTLLGDSEFVNKEKVLYASILPLFEY